MLDEDISLLLEQKRVEGENVLYTFCFYGTKKSLHPETLTIRKIACLTPFY